LTPTVCKLERTSTECHLKKTQKGAYGQRLIPSTQRASLNHRSNNHLNHAHVTNTPPTIIYKSSCSISRPNRTTNKPNESTCHEYLSPNTAPPPSHQHQTIETQEDLHQDSEEEIEAVIEDELAHLYQENERLCHMQEHLAR
jgi:hypothetical protein